MILPEFHKPVLVNQTIALLDPREGGVFVDATLGGGGHAARILEKIGPNGVLIGIDRDPDAIEHSRERLKQYGSRLRLVQGDFEDIESILASEGVNEIDGVIFDFGVSSHMLDSERGFTFQRDEELDMRMNPAQIGPSARDIVNLYGESDLADIIHLYGEERFARRIARVIVERRQKAPITRTRELADIICSAVGREYRGQDIHPATRTFQAIRIEVNRELKAIESALPAAVKALKVGGRVCAISFHSLEDRIVKNTFRRLSGRCECPPRLPECRCGARKMLWIITRKPILPDADEVANNVRARSAKLRCAERSYEL